MSQPQPECLFSVVILTPIPCCGVEGCIVNLSQELVPDFYIPFKAESGHGKRSFRPSFDTFTQ
jgi:hypothetical protein